MRRKHRSREGTCWCLFLRGFKFREWSESVSIINIKSYLKNLILILSHYQTLNFTFYLLNFMNATQIKPFNKAVSFWLVLSLFLSFTSFYTIYHGIIKVFIYFSYIKLNIAVTCWCLKSLIRCHQVWSDAHLPHVLRTRLCRQHGPHFLVHRSSLTKHLK